MKPDLRVTTDLGTVAGDVLAQHIAQIVARTGRCRLAVSGGSTPVPVFEHLVRVVPPHVMQAVIIGFIDDRHVPWTDGPPPADTNLLLAQQSGLLDAVGQVVPLVTPGLSLDASADAADRAVTALGGFDLVLLGVGPDGHVASIFPGHPSLADGQRTDVRVFAVRDSPKPPPERISLTLRVLTQVEHTVLVAQGAGKADVLARAWRGDADLPLTLAAPRGGWTWVLDPAAAAHLTAPGGST